MGPQNSAAMADIPGARLELAKHCSSRDWSKAIRLLDSLLEKSPSIQDYCNRALCYSKLELHNHVIKNCDKALEMNPAFPQAYILKGNALSALGRKEDALLVWKRGYEHALHEPTDLKLLLEIVELLASVKGKESVVSEELAIESSSSITLIPDTQSVDIDSSNTITSTLHTKDVTCEDHTMDSSSTNMTLCDTGFEMQSIPDNIHDLYMRSDGTTETPSRLSETITIGQKVFGADKSKTISVSLDFRLSRGIAQVNEGRYDEAISIFDQILADTPTYPEAWIARGTARAFQRELRPAISDFTKALEANPSAGEAWKRRGQARAALGSYLEAVEDLTRALKFEPRSLDILHERGIVRFKFKDYVAAVEDLSKCTSRDKRNKSAFTYLGLARSAIGEYLEAEKALLESVKIDHNFLDGWAHLAQYYLDLAIPNRSFECLERVLRVDERFVKAYHLRGLLYHGMGQHRIAIKDLSVGLRIEESNVECLYLRASCYHAIGDYDNAVKDYDTLLDLETDSAEMFVLQFLAYYQKEIALYTASRVEFDWFDIDRDVNSIFKEYWYQKKHPKDVADKVPRQPSLRDSLKKEQLKKKEPDVTKQKTKLLLAADKLGRKIQYDCAGFLPNKRQYRMAGLAAVGIAQKVSTVWRRFRSANQHPKRTRRKENFNISNQYRGGVSCTPGNSSETSTSYGFNEDRTASGLSMTWQDIYSIAVKWRQISEPCDPVFWIDKLSENSNSGIGSQTPMLLGQAKVVRYFPNYQRTLLTAKSLMMEQRSVYDLEDNIVDISEDGKLQRVKLAQSCSDLYDVVGQSFWVVTTCDSTAFEGRLLEGTRIVVKMDTGGFDFRIKTPYSSSRWDVYDAEMAKAWEALCNVYCGELYGSNDLNLLNDVKDAILRMSYYWYNFMPLSRGSAVVGYTVLLGLLLAANMEVTASIPQGIQVDWEAILSPNPNAFIDSVKAWLYPSLKFSTSWKNYPNIDSTFYATESVVAALSSVDEQFSIEV